MQRARRHAGTLGTIAAIAWASGCASNEPHDTAAAQAPDRSDDETLPTAAALAKTLPSGWSLSADGKVLRWEAAAPIPVRDAYIQVRVHDELAIPANIARNRKSLSVLLPSGLSDLSRVRVLASGAPLDLETGADSVERVAVPQEFAEGAAAPGSATPTLPAADDLGRPGPYQTSEGEYDEPALKVAGLKTPVEVRAVVVAPVGAAGPRPVAVFLHGNHSTCFSPDDPENYEEMGQWPCRAGFAPIPSYRGYLDAQRLLASQGVITISVSANAINAQSGQDFDLDAAARAALLNEHVSRWARGAAGFSGAGATLVRNLEPDLTKLMLVGHSRGGDGINRFALDSVTNPAAPWRIKALYMYGPTSMRRNPAPGVPTVVVLPACDGDVVSLEGQQFVDGGRDTTADSALRSILYVEGANHNNFNTRWTLGAGPDAGDDWQISNDPTCGPSAPTRLTAEAQRTVGDVYAAAVAQTFLFERAELAPLFDGTNVRAAPAGDAVVRTHALGGHRAPLVVPSQATRPLGTSGVTARNCFVNRPFDARDACLVSSAAVPPRAPSFGTSQLFITADQPSRTAVDLSWSRRGGRAQIAIGNGALDAQATALAARIIVPPRTSVALIAHLIDKAGKRLTLGRASVTGVPANASTAAGTYWAQEVRFPLDRVAAATAQIDLTQLATLELEPESTSGRLWLLDAWSYRPGLPAAVARSVARIDAQPLTVTETDAPQRVRIPVSIAGRLNEPAVVYYEISDFEGTAPVKKTVTIPAGSTSFDLEHQVKGDDVEGGPRYYHLLIIGLSGAVTGNPTAYLTVEDDEPTPPISIVSTRLSAREGTPLVWTFKLARPSARTLVFGALYATPEPGTTELTTADLDPSDPAPQPLSATGQGAQVVFEPGQLSATLTLDAVIDGVEEGPESVAYELTSKLVPGAVLPPIPGIADGTRLTGTVTD